MNKVLTLILSSVLLLTACGGAKQTSANQYGYDEDTILWINADGTDCDYGDYLEGDEDCRKTKKKLYHKTPSSSVVAKAKSHYGIKSAKAKSTTKDKDKAVKKKATTVKKKTNTYKKKTTSTFKSATKSSFKSSSSKRRR